MSSNDRLAKLKRLQAAKNNKSGNDYLDNSDDENGKLYDEIDEKEYSKRRRQEMLEDDFVVDDDGLGYVDRGVEYDEPEDYSDESDTDITNKKTKKKGKEKNKSSNDQIDNMLRAQHNKSVLKMQKKETKKTIAIDEFDDIFDDFEASNSRKSSIKHKATNFSSSPNSLKRNVDPNSSLTDIVKKQKVEINSSPLKNQTYKRETYGEDFDDLINDIDRSPTIKALKKEIEEESKEVIDLNSTIDNTLQREKAKDNDSDSDSDDDLIYRRRPIRSANTSRQITFSSKSNTGSSPFVTAPGTPVGFSSIKKTGTLNRPIHYSTDEPLMFSNRYDKNQIINPQSDSFQFYWLDFAEVNNTLLLFGKAKAQDNSFVSAMVQINGLYRELYFLPKEGKTAIEVNEEIIPLLMDKYGLSNIRSKPHVMKYAFEIPGVPYETEYLKVLLPFDTPKSAYDLIPSDLSSETFSRVFGGNTKLFESFAIQNKIMGPCWLEIKNGDFDALQNASHCSIEVSIASPSDVSLLNIKTVPPLNCISISLQTMMNSKENKQEIISITLAKYNNIQLDVPIPEDLKPDEITTLVRPPHGNSFPVGLTSLAKKKLNGTLRTFNNERALLACFGAMIKVSDPDVLIGHRLETVTLDVIIHRMYDSKTPTFSTIGRRARKIWPEKFNKVHSGMNQFFVKELVAGRLICDIANEMGQSLTPKCQSWTLSEMHHVTCGKDHKPLEINYANESFAEDENNFNMALQENVSSAMIAAEVSFRIQLLSLTKQLTILAGNAWSQTLGGTRAGRNEYILLHEFAKNGFIVPDKETQKTRNQRIQEQNNDANTPATAGPSKKAKYQGGLVFEPEKGLHKNYVLVMDFNSLYPSIIQEFNICFTTVKRNLFDIDELPDVPSNNLKQGVLPRLLATLVERRREVKRIMKTEKDPHKYVQCDIRQQALKLTANSMYGCLGYVNSRFYAKPLAMLVTTKGREILMNTRQLAESIGLTVVYGDTDSVMIDTGCETYAEAIKIGENFKRLVNERYKLLEIDIDNVFKKLLLHAKKKYAALNVTIDKNGNEKLALEVKGLDMRRREFSPLSKEVSTHVLNTILSDTDPETALQEIYEYLEDIRNKVENNKVRIDKYKINTKLSKDPGSYPNGKSMPAVQVALRMRKEGKMVKAGNVITFIITKDKNKKEDEASGHPAERAQALTEVLKNREIYQPDPEYYLEKQIFSPIERLLEKIEGFDVVRLSTALGLDSKKYLRRDYDDNANGNAGLQPLESTVSDSERFRDTSNLHVTCPKCSSKFPFGGIVPSNYYQLCFDGLQCKKCEFIFSAIQLSSQLESTIRAHISLYYAGWLVCDDSTCDVTTRQISVFGKRCLVDGCTGVIRYRYSDKQLYHQLLYFESLFNLQKNKNRELKPIYYPGDKDFPKDQIPQTTLNVLIEQNRELFEINQMIVQKYLSNSSRRYVNMTSLFDFMNE